MKTIHLIVLIFILLTANLFGQAPDKFSYQSVIRNNSNQLVASSTVGIRISILQGSVFGASVYVETHVTSTNSNGLASIEVGGGSPVFGAFSTIDWSNGPLFIKTETDPQGGTAYSITSTTQLLSVPYALYAKTSGSSVSAGWGLNGNTGTNPNLNFIGTTDNQPLIFKSNNSISGLVGSGQSNTSFGYLSLSNLTTGLYNTSMGYRALNACSGGGGNTGFGYGALENVTGTENTAVGYHALNAVTGAIHNTAVGNEALLYNTASANTAVGMRALRQNTSGNGLVAVGVSALYLNTTGAYNTSVGQGSMFNSLTGNNNTAIGFGSLGYNTVGSDNTSLGCSSLGTNVTGSKNLALGTNADVISPGLTMASAIGYNAKVATSYSMVLGGTGADAINVGIGTTSPARTLHVNAIMRLEPIPSAPTSPAKGDIYFDSTLNKLRVFDGVVWQNCW